MLMLFKDEFRRRANTFTEAIPYHYDIDHIFSKLQEYILEKKESMDEKLYVLFDYPGMGKTSTILNAAIQTKSLYVQLPLASSQLISGIENRIMSLMSQHQLFSENQLLSIIESVCWAAVYRIFQLVDESITTDATESEIYIKENGIPDIDSTTAGSGITLLVKSILQNSNRDVIVLHFDECQTWSVQSSFERQMDRDKSSLLHSDIPNYYMIGMSKVLTKLNKEVFVALTGTNVGAVKRIRIGSGVKLYRETNLKYSNADILLTIFKHFCNCQIPDQSLLRCFKELEGPFRIFYYFLSTLYDKHRNDAANVLTENLISGLIEKSYQQWSNGDLFQQFFSNRINSEKSLQEILFCALYPQFFAGETVIYNTIDKTFSPYNKDVQVLSSTVACVAKFNQRSFPDRWMKYHDIGLVRWQTIGTDYIMEPPFPFLRRLWCDSAAATMFPHMDIEQFKSYLSVGMTATGVFGHAFQFAVALELTLPQSPLFHKILPNGYTPLAQEYKWDSFTLDSIPTNPSATIYYAIDRSKPVKDYDIITYINDGSRVAQKVIMQVKDDTNSTRCKNSASKLFQLDSDVKVMISWHPHQLKALAKEKCLVIAGPSDFAGTAFPFQYVFGDRSQFTDYREVRKQLKKHPFFERMLEEPGSKRRKLTHSSYSSQVVNENHSVPFLQIDVRKYEKKKGCIQVAILDEVKDVGALLELICDKLKEDRGTRVALRTADEKERLIMDIKQLQDGMLYHALKQEQEAIFLENQLQLEARNDEKINTKRYHYFTVILNDKQYTIYLDDQKIDNVTQLLQVIKVQLIDDEVLKESDKITSIETQIGSVVTKTVLKKITTEPTCFVIQIE